MRTYKVADGVVWHSDTDRRDRFYPLAQLDRADAEALGLKFFECPMTRVEYVTLEGDLEAATTTAKERGISIRFISFRAS